MPRTASQGQVKSSAAIAGPGAALAACAITIAVAGGSSPAATPAHPLMRAGTCPCQAEPACIALDQCLLRGAPYIWARPH